MHKTSGDSVRCPPPHSPHPPIPYLRQGRNAPPPLPSSRWRERERGRAWLRRVATVRKSLVPPLSPASASLPATLGAAMRSRSGLLAAAAPPPRLQFSVCHLVRSCPLAICKLSVDMDDHKPPPPPRPLLPHGKAPAADS